jgi:hypothetical protein
VPDRELVVLGTASQAPTRSRNHNGYLLRWGGEGFLFDPGGVVVGFDRPVERCLSYARGTPMKGTPNLYATSHRARCSVPRVQA